MASITETLMQAAQDLRDACASVLGLRTDMVALKASTVSEAQAAIQVFTARSLIKTLCVDPFNGNDANNGFGYATALKTLDAAFTQASADYILQIYLFGDDVIRRRHTTFGKTIIFGVSPGVGVFGSSYVEAVRKISFAPEAVNSPYVSFGRIPAGFFMYGGSIRSNAIDWEIANLPAGVNYTSHISVLGNSDFTFLNSTITASVAGGRGTFIDPQGSQVSLTLGGSLGANAAGRLVVGVAAGTNPNNNWTVRSNLTSA